MWYPKTTVECQGLTHYLSTLLETHLHEQLARSLLAIGQLKSIVKEERKDFCTARYIIIQGSLSY